MNRAKAQPQAARIFPRHLAEQGQELSGSLAVSKLPRLRDLTANGQGEMRFRLQFALGENKTPTATGEADVEVEFACQRCLEGIRYHIHSDIQVEWVEDDDARAANDGYEPIVGSGAEDLAQFLESELLLELPFAPMHEEGLCRVDADYVAQGDGPKAESPFAALSEFKPQGH
ncbi:MAG: hypothetical protein HOI95_05575 [Chromatiales bacterium]|jgi:uncharacterized protein|nr:hypothetical protein [Chromatiales bacterium]